MPESMVRVRREDGASFYCPNGHSLTFGESEAKRLRRYLDQQRAVTRAAQDQADAAERSLRATRGHLTRARNRARAGVCPVGGCSRHFQNLQRHIATKHPDLCDQGTQ